MTEEQQQMIDDILKRDNKLSDWEYTFIDSIQHRSSLSDKQAEKLEKIWDRVTA